jgi:four helix bundle protein
MASYRDLLAWQRAFALAEDVYRLTSSFPPDERFGLTAQMRRSSTSIACDIAEGHGRLTNRDWQHFLSQARGSVLELETQLLLASRLQMTDSAEVETILARAEEVGKIINGLLRSTKKAPPRKVFAP